MTDCSTQVLGQTFTNTTCVQLDTLIALLVVLIIVLIIALAWLGLSLNKFMDTVREHLLKKPPPPGTSSLLSPIRPGGIGGRRLLGPRCYGK